jgi:hypothetical protein
MTTEQQQVFDRYFRTEGEQHICKNLINFHVNFFDFEISRDTEMVLEIKVNNTVITMWKQVQYMHITIL